MDQTGNEQRGLTARLASRSRAIRIAAAAVAAVALIVLVAVIGWGSGDSPASTNDAVRIGVTILIPTAAIVTYWWLAGRQLATERRAITSERDADHRLLMEVSHDLRDKLTVIYGFSETLLDTDLGDPTEVRDIVQVINTAALDLGRTVDDLVSAAELDSGSIDIVPRRFDPAAEVERVVVPMRKAGADISVDCWSGDAQSDPAWFRQIIRSLVANAVDHGGPSIAIVGERTDEGFRCTVADDGDGIDPVLAARLFTHTATPLTHGWSTSGLGIPVAIALAEQLGGAISHERAHGMTLVTLELPTDSWGPLRTGGADTAADGGPPEDEAEADDAVTVDLDEPGGVDGSDDETEPRTVEAAPSLQ